MARQTIRRHGDRWALYEDDDQTPRAEYATREEAALAHGDAEVDDTPRGEALGGGAVGDEDSHVRTKDAAIDQRTAGAGSNEGTTQEPQGGL